MVGNTVLSHVGMLDADLQAKRGTPCYMAPELFQDGSTHSSAADLWALGCVLYECAAGHPPFVSTSFNHLVKDILTSSPAALPSKLPTTNNHFCSHVSCQWVTW